MWLIIELIFYLNESGFGTSYKCIFCAFFWDKSKITKTYFFFSVVRMMLWKSGDASRYQQQQVQTGISIPLSVLVHAETKQLEKLMLVTVSCGLTGHTVWCPDSVVSVALYFQWIHRLFCYENLFCVFSLEALVM